MAEYIDRKALDKSIRRRFDMQDVYLPIHFLNYVNSIPAADVVEVVRCKDCDLWNEWDCAGHKETGNFVCSCAYFSNEDGYIVYTEPDDYCSKSERTEGKA